MRFFYILFGVIMTASAIGFYSLPPNVMLYTYCAGVIINTLLMGFALYKLRKTNKHRSIKYMQNICFITGSIFTLMALIATLIEERFS